MKVKYRPESNTLDLCKGKKVVASVTFHEDGLLEYSSRNMEVGIESIGTKEEQIVVNQLAIKNAA